jgi:hypothetical protein
MSFVGGVELGIGQLTYCQPGIINSVCSVFASEALLLRMLSAHNGHQAAAISVLSLANSSSSRKLVLIIVPSLLGSLL